MKMISNTNPIYQVGGGKKTFSTPKTGEDEKLAEAIKGRDETAFRRVLEKYQAWVYQIIYNVLHNPEETEEVWQDAFFKVWQKIDLFHPNGGELQAWIGTIARNAAIDYLRRRNRRFEQRLEQVHPQGEDSLLFIDCCPTADRPLEELEAKELECALWEELAHLNPKHQMAWRLRHQEELSIKEIATQMAAPEGSVKIWIFRATRELARKLQQRGFLPMNSLRL